MTVLTDSIPKELIDYSSQYQFKFVLAWKMGLAHEVVYDYLHPLDIPSVFQQRVGTEVMLSFHGKGSQFLPFLLSSSGNQWLFHSACLKLSPPR